MPTAVRVGSSGHLQYLLVRHSREKRLDRRVNLFHVQETGLVLVKGIKRFSCACYWIFHVCFLDGGGFDLVADILLHKILRLLGGEIRQECVVRGQDQVKQHVADKARVLLLLGREDRLEEFFEGDDVDSFLVAKSFRPRKPPALAEDSILHLHELLLRVLLGHLESKKSKSFSQQIDLEEIDDYVGDSSSNGRVRLDDEHRGKFLEDAGDIFDHLAVVEPCLSVRKAVDADSPLPLSHFILQQFRLLL
mmetsp:Transcript_24103/g.54096  ORF Transcript_24103/g.54096 Transcript_24103/m.54096 type:complete len:249 (+) Transcript_24103:446-1192(+)